MDKFINLVTAETVLGVQWDGSKEHGSHIGSFIDMDVRYDMTDGKLTMHIGGYDNLVANEFDFVGVNSAGVFACSYDNFMRFHMLDKPSDVRKPSKSKSGSFDEAVAPIIEWLRMNEDDKGQLRLIADSKGAELLEINFYANYKSK